MGSVAIVVHDTFAVAYFCNGRTQEAWFKGTPHNGKLSMTGKNNATLTANYALGHARGTVTVDGISYVFSIIAVHKPSGLFQSIAIVRGATIKAGWIVLANGTQVGSIEPDANAADPVFADGAEARPLHPDGAGRRHHDHRYADRRRNRQRVLTPGHWSRAADQEGKQQMAAQWEPPAPTQAGSDPARHVRQGARRARARRLPGGADAGHLRAAALPDRGGGGRHRLLQRGHGEVRRSPRARSCSRSSRWSRPWSCTGRSAGSPRRPGSAACTGGRGGSRSSSPCRSWCTACTRSGSRPSTPGCSCTRSPAACSSACSPSRCWR